MAISWPPELTGSCYYEIATAQIKCLHVCHVHMTNILHVSYVHISSAAVFQQDNKHLKDELHSHFLQQTSPSVLQVFQITQEFAVNGVLCGFFDLNISFANKSQNYRAD